MVYKHFLILAVVALVVAATPQEKNHPPNHHDHRGHDHHGHDHHGHHHNHHKSIDSRAPQSLIQEHSVMDTPVFKSATLEAELEPARRPPFYYYYPYFHHPGPYFPIPLQEENNAPALEEPVEAPSGNNNEGDGLPSEEHDGDDAQGNVDSDDAQEESVAENSEDASDEGSADEDNEDVVPLRKTREVPETKQEEINEQEAEREVELIEEEDEFNRRLIGFVACDYNTSPLLSCHDCRTRKICKFPIGGKLVSCNYALQPYCNKGICSAIPSAGCS